MPGRDVRCTTCQHDQRDEIDRLLLSGIRPATVWRDLADGLGIARSSLFRHARGHVALSPLGSHWVDGESSTADVISDLGALRRSLIKQRAAALAAGSHTVAIAAAQRLESVSLTLLREAGVTGDQTGADLRAWDMLGAGVRYLAAEHPDAVRRLAALIRSFEVDGDYATTRDYLATTILESIPTQPKE